jgi:hypothetical protein
VRDVICELPAAHPPLNVIEWSRISAQESMSARSHRSPAVVGLAGALIYFQISFNHGTAFFSPSTKRLVS